MMHRYCNTGRPDNGARGVIYNVKELYKKYPGQSNHALKDVWMQIPHGMTAILGVSGTGKTTLLNIIGGIDSPDYGQVFFFGQNVEFSPERMAMLRRHVSMVFQDHMLISHLNALDNVALPMILRHGASWRQSRNIARKAIQSIFLEEAPEIYTKIPSKLSGGQNQRVSIARAIACKHNNSHVILADEPTGNLDMDNSVLVMETLRRICDTEGVPIVLVTHNRELAQRYCETIFEYSGRRWSMKGGEPHAVQTG